MRKNKLLLLLLPLSALCSCTLNNGECTIHTDVEGDGICDKCGLWLGAKCSHHYDANEDNICDECHTYMRDYEKENENVTTYLVLSSIGRYNGQQGVFVESQFLENTIVFNAKPGTALPGPSQITDVNDNAVFSSWISYDGGGVPTIYSVVPGKSGHILYANFNKKTGTEDNPNVGEDEVVYNLLTNFGTQNWSTDNAVISALLRNSVTNAEKAFTLSALSNTNYSFIAPKTGYDRITFYRYSNSNSFNKDEYWNKTNELVIDGTHTIAEITNWNSVAWKNN